MPPTFQPDDIVEYAGTDPDALESHPPGSWGMVLLAADYNGDAHIDWILSLTAPLGEAGENGVEIWSPDAQQELRMLMRASDKKWSVHAFEGQKTSVSNADGFSVVLTDGAVFHTMTIKATDEAMQGYKAEESLPSATYQVLMYGGGWFVPHLFREWRLPPDEVVFGTEDHPVVRGGVR